jgi:hypothetical protein
MSLENITIIKASGEREPWDSHKLERSLRAARANEDLIREITMHIEKDLQDGMRTSDIYEHAFALLQNYSRPVAAEYSLKKVIMQLGPSGFPFERFVAEILKAQGYTTEVGTMVQGSCVEHEVDVLAEKPGERIVVEAKFHNSVEVKSDVKVALYVHARFLDIEKRYRENDGETEMHIRPWLITNTSFTSQAIQYGRCAGLAMTGWNYPKGHTLQDLVQSTQTHPVTCLTTLSDTQKKSLLESGIVLCHQVVRSPSVLTDIGMNKPQINAVLEEGNALCGLR